MAPTVRQRMISHNMKPRAGVDWRTGGAARAAAPPRADSPGPALRVLAAPPACSRVAAAVLSQACRGGSGTHFCLGGRGDCGELFQKPHSGLLLTFHWTMLWHEPIPRPITGKENGPAACLFTNCPQWNECWAGALRSSLYNLIPVDNPSCNRKSSKTNSFNISNILTH